MDDVCRLKSVLALRGLFLQIPGLQELDKVCSSVVIKDNGLRLGYNVFDWSYPILLGCITANGKNTSCRDDTSSGKYFAKVFLIKPSYGNKELQSAINTVASPCRRDRESKACKVAVKDACQDLAPNTPYQMGPVAGGGVDVDWKYEKAISCELLGFIVYNSFSGGGINEKDKCPYFPQHSTINLTVNSSPWIYGASRELGRYYARQLGWFFGQGLADAETTKRFERAIYIQMQNPIPHDKVKAGLLFTNKAGPTGDCMYLNE